MISEINLHFNNSQQVTIQLVQHSSVTVDFGIPFTAQDREAIRHYLEVYAAQYVMDIDDQEAKRVTAQLPQWGQSLFDAVFNNVAAKQLFSQFINTPSEKYLLSITARQPEILSLPWELLHDAGQFLFAFQPSITILRRIPAKTTFPAYKIQSQLHILFLISRPQGESFINPRTDAQAVLKAIENYLAISVEFLQPASLENLWQRLQNPELPRVDVIHFDGHGYFDKTGDLAHTTIRQLSGLSRDLRKQLRNLKIETNSGYLLFEKADKYGKKGRDKFYVPTSWLSHILSESKVRFMVLSACQSAMVVHDDEETEEEPIGSIAVGLAANSVPSVLAMSYSVMVRATELLFGTFYMDIAVGNSVGIALDKARHALLQDRKRRDLQRGQERVEIEVSDWFLPTLYQANEDTVLVSRMRQELPKPHKHNLSALPDAGFWGRRRELWQIENWFIDGIRRVVISGFSGQGKTFLAQELGRWLLQKANFDAVVFVDYSGYQGQDAVQWAVTSLGSVLEQSLVGVAAANTVLLNNRILLILDNLEVYVTEKQDTLQELLTVAHQWSLLGESRVLITTRPVELGHEAYQVDDENFRQLVLEGLDKEDALYYFEQLLVLSNNPLRLQTDELLRWFAKVQFHPLSIGLLARSLETEDFANLEARLNQLMLELPDNPVEATLQLVIEQLDEESRRLLPRLGVFQGGALLSNLIAITEFSESQWQNLLFGLILVGLIIYKDLDNNNTYLKFHPVLSSLIWSQFANIEKVQLLNNHKIRYFALSEYLCDEDFKVPYKIRTIAQNELPNLLFAAHRALDTEEIYSTKFIKNINIFLNVFGLKYENKILSQRIEHLNDFFALSNKAEQLYYEGKYQQATQLFTKILTSIEEQTSYKRCFILAWLGRCFHQQGQAEQATECYRQGLIVAEQLELSQDLKILLGSLHMDLADILRDTADYEGAKINYEKSQIIDKEIGNIREEATLLSQLGTLALRQGKFKEASQYYNSAMTNFHHLNEPQAEAEMWHKLGEIYIEIEHWDMAEQAYRKAVNIFESIGNLKDTVSTWNNLALIAKYYGKLKEAEAWYNKSIYGAKISRDKQLISLSLHNLADLLQTYYPNRLLEAQQLAEESLAINTNLDLAIAEIWLTYELLAQIADKQGNVQEAKKYRRLSREAKANFAGTRYELKQEHSELILAVAQGENIDVALERYGGDLKNFKTAIQQILAGERDAEKLCESLHYK